LFATNSCFGKEQAHTTRDDDDSNKLLSRIEAYSLSRVKQILSIRAIIIFLLDGITVSGSTPENVDRAADPQQTSTKTKPENACRTSPFNTQSRNGGYMHEGFWSSNCREGTEQARLTRPSWSLTSFFTTDDGDWLMLGI
jgi:hypothetical protein